MLTRVCVLLLAVWCRG